MDMVLDDTTKIMAEALCDRVARLTGPYSTNGNHLCAMDRLMFNDVLTFVQDSIGKDSYIDPKSGKVVPVAESLEVNLPWLFIKQNPEMLCKVYQLCADKAGFIHSRCRNCWKVVARPKTVYALFQAYEIMEKMGRSGKCGIEERSYVQTTGKLYGCYWYCQSKEAGQQVADEAREAFDSAIPGNTEIYLKQSCTEMELEYGPWSKYQRPEWADLMEREIEDMFVMERATEPIPKCLRRHIVMRWLKFAAEHNDWTFELFNNGEKAIPEIEKVYIP